MSGGTRTTASFSPTRSSSPNCASASGSIPARARMRRREVGRAVAKLGLTFSADLDFSRAAAGLAFAATSAHRARGFISEGGAEFVSRGFSSAVATCAIPVARGIAIVARLGGHTAPPSNFRDSAPGFRLCQTDLVQTSLSVNFSQACSYGRRPISFGVARAHARYGRVAQACVILVFARADMHTD